MLEGFGDYLVRKARLNEKYIAYYVNWVSSCYFFINLPDNSILTPDQLQNYLNHISKTREDWQVKQAETALRHYGFYLSSGVEKATVAVKAVKPDTDGDEPLWTALEKKTRDALRLRHRSYSTEKTYINWLRSFRRFAGKKGYDIRTIQELLGHDDLKTTMVYTHVAKLNVLGVKSPLDG